VKSGRASGRVGSGVGLLVALGVALSGSSGVRAQTVSDALLPGDVVRVAISGEATLTGDYAVDASGTVSLPLIGTRSVTGVPAERLRQDVLEAYNAQFRNQSIQVTVLRRIRVLGAVRPSRDASTRPGWCETARR
jgi:protein involved in polysaccharide export with SLBB domain